MMVKLVYIGGRQFSAAIKFLVPSRSEIASCPDLYASQRHSKSEDGVEFDFSWAVAHVS
jgi:hypothetical protein